MSSRQQPRGTARARVQRMAERNRLGRLIADLERLRTESVRDEHHDVKRKERTDHREGGKEGVAPTREKKSAHREWVRDIGLAGCRRGAARQLVPSVAGSAPGENAKDDGLTRGEREVNANGHSPVIGPAHSSWTPTGTDYTLAPQTLPVYTVVL